MLALVLLFAVAALANYDVSNGLVTVDPTTLVVNLSFDLTIPSGIQPAGISGTTLSFNLVRDCGNCAGLIEFDTDTFTFTFPDATAGTCAVNGANPNIVDCQIGGTAMATSTPQSGTASIQMITAFPGCCASCGDEPVVAPIFQGSSNSQCINMCEVGQELFQIPMCGQE